MFAITSVDEQLVACILKSLFGTSLCDELCECGQVDCADDCERSEFGPFVTNTVVMDGSTKITSEKQGKGSARKRPKDYQHEDYINEADRGTLSRCLSTSMQSLVLSRDRVLTPPQEDLELYTNRVIEEYRRMMKDGDPILGVEVQEPYHSPDFVHSEHHTLVNFTIKLSEIVIHGLSDYIVERIEVDRERRVTHMDILLQINGSGIGKMDAYVLGLPWTQSSTFTIDVTNCRVSFLCKWSPRSDGTISVDEMEVTSTEDKIDLCLKIMLGANRLVSRVFNTRRVYNSYRPVLENTFRLSLMKIMADYGRRFPKQLSQWKNNNREHDSLCV